MTTERLEELRRLAADPRWGCSNHVAELLEEVDRLRALQPRLHRVEALLGALVKRLERVREECRDA